MSQKMRPRHAARDRAAGCGLLHLPSISRFLISWAMQHHGSGLDPNNTSNSSNNNEVSVSPKESLFDFLAGSLGATTSVYVGQPMDTLKVKMQTFPEKYPNVGICFR